MLAINADGKEKEEDDDGGDSALRLCLCTRFLKHVCSRETGLVMTDSQELRGQTDVTGKAKANFRGKIRRTLPSEAGTPSAENGAVVAGEAGCYAWRVSGLFMLRR